MKCKWNGDIHPAIKKTGIRTAILAFSITAAILPAGCASGSGFTKEQAMVKDGYERIKDIMLDPESMIVYDCCAWTGKTEDQYEAESKARSEDEEAEVPDNLFVTYYHVGARNRLGGMSESQYIVLYDLETGEYRSSGEKEKVDEAVNAYIEGDKSVSVDRDVQGEFLNVDFWQLIGWPDSVTDYEDFIKSEDFEKVDVKKILG